MHSCHANIANRSKASQSDAIVVFSSDYETLDNILANVFGFGSISIKALMYGTNRYRGVTSDPDYFCLMGAIIMHYKGIPCINVVM